MIAPSPTSPLDHPSLVHRLDARVKLLALLAILIAAVTTPPGRPTVFLACAVLVLTVAMAARIPLHSLLRRYAALGTIALAMTILIPVLRAPQSPGDVLIQAGFMTISRSGTALFIAAFAKASIGILCALVLRDTTPFPDLLQGLERLRVPATLVAITAMTYRYLFVLADEALRLRRARDARAYGGRWLWHAQVVGQMIGSLFLRAHDRAERVYAAMLSRGFTGKPPRNASAPLKAADYAFLAAALLVAVAIRVVLP